MKKALFVLVIIALLVAPVFAQGEKEAGAAKQIVLRLADNQPI
ncbi:MAG: TRAP transporter substrate-binding protein, partial [Spirochaetales bacterium]|nr:TRAP transporter substrate-binding protein [Spirochaetales bacterium]